MDFTRRHYRNYFLNFNMDAGLLENSPIGLFLVIPYMGMNRTAAAATGKHNELDNELDKEKWIR